MQWALCEYAIIHAILPPSPVILWIELGGKSKWLPLNFGYHDVMRTGPIIAILLQIISSFFFFFFLAMHYRACSKHLCIFLCCNFSSLSGSPPFMASTAEELRGEIRKGDVNLETDFWSTIKPSGELSSNLPVFFFFFFYSGSRLQLHFLL